MIDIIIAICAFFIGGACGAAGYRYMLKRDPQKIELWAAQIKEASERLKSQVDQSVK